jgi:hypothetical protein
VLLRLCAGCCLALSLGGCGGNGGGADGASATTTSSLPQGCDPAAVKGAIDEFLAAITAGDRGRILRSLSPEPDFERLAIADPDGVFRTTSRTKAADYLAARHAHAENERLLQAIVDSGADAGHALVRFTIVRTAADFPARDIHNRAAIGEATINCLTQRISRWRLATGRA